MASSRKIRRWNKACQITFCIFVMLLSFLTTGNAYASTIVVSHDINTLATSPNIPSGQEPAFAVNVARFLTSGSPTKNLLLYESNPGDPTRNYSPSVIAALIGAGFAVTVTPNYATPFTSFDAIFVAQDFPTV